MDFDENVVEPNSDHEATRAQSSEHQGETNCR
jgi:hypothetical protein